MAQILVIEDELVIRTAMVEMLRHNGFRVIAAEAGAEGLELARQQTPDLIICDLMMTGVDGSAVLQQIRSDARTAAVPFIFVTARSQREDVRRLMELGADDCLGKPFEASELVNAVNAQLKKRATIAAKYETTLRLLRKNITYSLPHEMRTPLMSILGYADLLLLEAKQLTPDDITEMAGYIRSSGRRLHRVIENYLVLAQIEMLETDLEQRIALRNHILKNVGKIVEDQAQKVAARFKRDDDLRVKASSLAARVSEPDLRKIVEELVDNAFKFSQAGDEVLVEVRIDQTKLVLLVRDYGRGMTPEQIESIDAYMQFERALHEQQGLGLGFTIAQRLVKLYEGSITIKSAPSQGTLVAVELPF